MTRTTETIIRESLSGARLAERFALQPAQVDALRRTGELLGVRSTAERDSSRVRTDATGVRNGRDYYYPAWQFNGGGKALPQVKALVAAARANGMSDEELCELLTTRVGMTQSRVIDLVRSGDTALAHRLVRRVR